MFLSCLSRRCIPASDAARLSSSNLRILSLKLRLSRTSVCRKISGVVGCADRRYEGFETLLDLLCRRVGEAVEEEGVGLARCGYMGEELFHLALAAGAQIDELEARRTFELCRIGHARTAESRTVGDARTDHHDPVAEGIGCGFDAGAGVDADFERFHLVEQRQVEQALLLGAVHVLDEGGLVVGSQTGTGDAGEDPLAVALDVKVHSLLREPRHVGTGFAVGRRPAGGDRAAVGAEDHGHAGRIGVIEPHGLRQIGIVSHLDAVEGLLRRVRLVHERERRGVDVVRFGFFGSRCRADAEHAEQRAEREQEVFHIRKIG